MCASEQVCGNPSPIYAPYLSYSNHRQPIYFLPMFWGEAMQFRCLKNCQLAEFSTVVEGCMKFLSEQLPCLWLDQLARKKWYASDIYVSISVSCFYQLSTSSYGCALNHVLFRKNNFSHRKIEAILLNKTPFK